MDNHPIFSSWIGSQLLAMKYYIHPIKSIILVLPKLNNLRFDYIYIKLSSISIISNEHYDIYGVNYFSIVDLFSVSNTNNFNKFS
jgi:hypothetical protein